jgi:hypothetical protein
MNFFHIEPDALQRLHGILGILGIGVPIIDRNGNIRTVCRRGEFLLSVSVSVASGSVMELCIRSNCTELSACDARYR